MVIAGVALMAVLPQLAGFAAARWWRRPAAWPLTAGTIFAVVWYAAVWAPASAAAEQRRALHHCACGMWAVADVMLLLVGLAIHLGGGSFLTWLDRRAHRTFTPAGKSTP